MMMIGINGNVDCITVADIGNWSYPEKDSFSRDKKIIEIFVAHSFCDSFTLFQMTSLWRARILPSVLACSSSGQSTWKEAASKTAHKWMPKLLTPALSICSHFLQQPEQNTGIDYYSHAMEKVYLLHIFYKRTNELCRTIQISNIVLIYL